MVARAMAIGSATSNASVISRSILRELRLQEAKRTADEAQYKANDLQTQAARAQREANSAQERARLLKVAASQAKDTAEQTARAVSAGSALSQTGNRLAHAYTLAAKSTGTIIDTTA